MLMYRVGETASRFVLCIGRVTHLNESVIKSNKLLQPFPLLMVEDNKHSFENYYKLNSAICHLGNGHNSGHYICYNILSENFALEIDDDKTDLKSLDEVKTTIESNGYLFFYSRSSASAVEFSSCSDDEEKKMRLLPKKLIKRRKLPTEKTAPLKTFMQKRLTAFKPGYHEKDKFGNDQWESENKISLNFVRNSLMNVMSASLDVAEKEPKYYRHFLFCKDKRKRELKQNALELDTDKVGCTAHFLVDLGSFMRRQFCGVVFKDNFVGEGPGKPSNRKIYSFTVGALQFKDNCLDKNSDLAEFFRNNEIKDCREYFKTVLDVEAFIFWTMTQLNLDYDRAAKILNLRSLMP